MAMKSNSVRNGFLVKSVIYPTIVIFSYLILFWIVEENFDVIERTTIGLVFSTLVTLPYFFGFFVFGFMGGTSELGLYFIFLLEGVLAWFLLHFYFKKWLNKKKTTYLNFKDKELMR